MRASSAELYSMVATVQDVIVDNVNNKHISGPTLVLLGYNLHCQELCTGNRGYVSAVYLVDFHTIQAMNVYPCY
jgi:hypothetical protein